MMATFDWQRDKRKKQREVYRIHHANSMLALFGIVLLPRCQCKMHAGKVIRSHIRSFELSLT